MATKPLTAPYAMGSAVMSFGTDDYTPAIDGATFTSSAPAVWRGIGGHRRSGKARWTLNISARQDLDPDGLMRYLLAHEGEEVAVTLVPDDGGPTIEATVVVAAPSDIGGTFSESGELTGFTASMECSGTPEFVDPS